MVRGHQPLPSGLREGDIVAGKYRIAEVIGAGAMGTVVAARHVLLEEKVAIKFLRPEALGHAEAVPRFLREARASVRIKSDHVVRVFDVDVLGESKAPYIVMEYLDGCDLAERLEREGSLPIGQAVDFVLQACEAIAEAHRLGIIHRDLKPANLFQVRRGDRDDFIKVVDFGISKLSELTATVARVGENEGGRGGDVEGAGDEGRLITADRVMMGSPVYMSPEQMESARDVDERTDVWALGVTLCELITGKLPFSGQSLVHVYFSIASDKPLRLLEWSPGLPRGLESAILKCLERDREKRFRSVNELARAIAAFGARASSAYLQRTRSGAGAELSVAETIGPTASAAPVGGQTLPSASHSEAAAKPRSTHRVVWAIAAILVVPILAYVLGTVRDRTEPSRSSTATSQTTVAPRPLPSTPAATSESIQASRSEPASSAAQLLAAPVTTSTAASPTAEPARTSSHAAAEPRPKHGAAPSTAPASESAASPGPSVTALTATAPSKPDVNASATNPSRAPPSPPPTSSTSLFNQMLQRQD